MILFIPQDSTGKQMLSLYTPDSTKQWWEKIGTLWKMTMWLKQIIFSRKELHKINVKNS